MAGFDSAGDLAGVAQTPQGAGGDTGLGGGLGEGEDVHLISIVSSIN